MKYASLLLAALFTSAIVAKASAASDQTQPEARDLQALTTMSTEFVIETTFLPQIKFGLTTHADVVQRGIDSSASPIASNGSIAVVLGHAGQLRKIR